MPQAIFHRAGRGAGNGRSTVRSSSQPVSAYHNVAFEWRWPYDTERLTWARRDAPNKPICALHADVAENLAGTPNGGSRALPMPVLHGCCVPSRPATGGSDMTAPPELVLARACRAGAQVASRRKAHHGSSRTVFHEGSGQARGTLTHRRGYNARPASAIPAAGTTSEIAPDYSAGAGAGGKSVRGGYRRLRMLLGLWGSSHLFGRPGNSRQTGKGGALEDLADVMERDDEFLEPVQGHVLLPAQ